MIIANLCPTFLTQLPRTYVPVAPPFSLAFSLVVPRPWMPRAMGKAVGGRLSMPGGRLRTAHGGHLAISRPSLPDDFYTHSENHLPANLTFVANGIRWRVTTHRRSGERGIFVHADGEAMGWHFDMDGVCEDDPALSGALAVVKSLRPER